MKVAETVKSTAKQTPQVAPRGRTTTATPANALTAATYGMPAACTNEAALAETLRDCRARHVQAMIRRAAERPGVALLTVENMRENMAMGDGEAYFTEDMGDGTTGHLQPQLFLLVGCVDHDRFLLAIIDAQVKRAVLRFQRDMETADLMGRNAAFGNGSGEGNQLEGLGGRKKKKARGKEARPAREQAPPPPIAVAIVAGAWGLAEG